ncbi:hypothetical protein ABPG75_008617 [Micractinium tetrahymenae]
MERLFAGALFAYEDQGEEPSELRGIIAYSGSGKLFVVGDDGTIKAADVRQQLLSGAWAQGGPLSGAAAAAPPAVRTISAHPPLELTTAHFCLNRSGTYAAVAGSALEDPEISRIVVVDLTNCRPAPTSTSAAAAKGSSGGGAGGTGAASAAAPAGRHDVCEAVVLDPELFASRPGLRVLQVAWHPDSDAHLAVLTSDNTWRLYNTQHADLAEQTFELQLRGRRGLGLGTAGSSSGGGRAVTAFAFGPPEEWQQFTVYFLTADGNVWSLCPVVPFGCRYPGSAIEQLAAACDPGASPNDEAWLQRAFAQLATPQDPAFASGMVQSVPHALDEHVPALAGPLPVACAGQQQGEQQASQLVQMSGGSDAAQALLLTRYAEGCSVLAAATARGWLGLHLVAGGASPCWYEAAPQCVCEGMDIQAVRSQVGAVAVAAGADQPQLLLLDVVDLSLPAEAASAAAAAAAGDPEDAELGGGGAGAVPASILLAQDAVAPELLYSVHSSGAHAISLSWLPLLAGLLAEEGRLPAALPRPGVELLLRSSTGLVAAAPVGDALSGSALVALEADGKPRCLRPHHAAVADGGSAAAAPAGAAAAGGGAAAAQKDVEAQLATFYGDLRKGPKPCALPAAAAGKPAGAGNPEGQRLLTEAAAALRASHVEFAHQAHQDLLERTRQLGGELGKQRQRAGAAERVAAQAEQAAAALDAKASRVLQFQENLGERLRLLAELHWSLPRPPSHAEQRFAAEQLPAFEAAAEALEEDARALRARVASLQRKLRSLGEVAAGAAGGTGAAAVPLHQLRRVREALGEQEALIGANQQRLAVLEEAVAAAGPH